MSGIFELDVNLELPDHERSRLTDRLLKVSSSPYENYEHFHLEIEALSKSDAIPDSMHRALETYSKVDQRYKPYFAITNAPIDPVLPVFDPVDPVPSKRALKKTFVAEGFLQVVSLLQGNRPIAYTNVNDGDVFQDVYAQKSLRDSQGQKSMGNVYFHSDLPNHFVRPDHINFICMRNSDENEVCTSFVRTIELIESLDAETLEILKQPLFSTPYDDITLMEAKRAGRELSELPLHPIWVGEYDMRFFITRTVGVNEQAQKALEKLETSLHRCKKRVQFQPGNFLSIHNTNSLHAKEIGHIGNAEELAIRWLIKTYSIDDASVLVNNIDNLIEGKPYLVNG